MTLYIDKLDIFVRGTSNLRRTVIHSTDISNKNYRVTGLEFAYMREHNVGSSTVALVQIYDIFLRQLFASGKETYYEAFEINEDI